MPRSGAGRGVTQDVRSPFRTPLTSRARKRLGEGRQGEVSYGLGPPSQPNLSSPEPNRRAGRRPDRGPGAVRTHRGGNPPPSRVATTALKATKGSALHGEGSPTSVASIKPPGPTSQVRGRGSWDVEPDGNGPSWRALYVPDQPRTDADRQVFQLPSSRMRSSRRGTWPS